MSSEFLNFYGTDKLYHHVRASRSWVRKNNVIVVENLSKDKFVIINPEIVKIIEEVAKENQERLEKEAKFYESMTGEEFKELCKKILIQSGWSVKTIPNTEKQGIDLIAEKEGIKLAIQCKKIKKSIGDKAVQEVSSGKEFYNADFPLVVSNAKFTEKAKELANKNRVLLLHYLELYKLSEKLSQNKMIK